jgi:uncharacterized protein
MQPTESARRAGARDLASPWVSRTRMHRLFVVLSELDRVPFALVLAPGILWATLLGVTARALFPGRSLAPVAALSLAYLFFVALDAVLLLLLPRLGLSFGPLNSVWSELALARWLLGLAVVAPAGVFGPAGWVPALVLFFVAQGLVTGCAVYACSVEPFALQVTRLEGVVPNLPPNNRLRIVHLSDIHVERLTRREHAVLGLVRELEPDYILLTGDYLNLSYVEDPNSADQFRAWARQLRAGRGIYAVAGGPPVETPGQAADLFRDTGVCLLDDELLTLVHDGCRLQIVGVSCSRDKRADGATLNDILKHADYTLPTILLYHTPDLMPAAADTSRIDVYLAGHTHGGQLCLPGYGALFTCSEFGKRYEAGPYRQGRTLLYVNRGIGLEGLSGPRARFLSQPEVLYLTLTGPSPVDR